MQPKMVIELIPEFKLNQKTKSQISHLLQVCFPEAEFGGRTYFKQLPHYRLLVKMGNELIGQLGLDYRMMTLNNYPINVLGIIDVAIFPTYQNQGVGSKLLSEVNILVQQHFHNIDFLLLAADRHEIYEQNGFKLTKQHVKWLAIDEHKNYGIQERESTDCLMYKQVGQIEWIENGKLDMLGYWY